MDRIRVHVLHEDPIARAGLSVALRGHADLNLVGPFDTERGDPPRSTAMPPTMVDIVLADFANAVAFATDLRRKPNASVAPRVVVVGGMDREWEIRHALDRGIRGYLVAGCGLDEIVAGVRAVHRGERYLSGDVAARLAESVSEESLTHREEEVLRLVVEGLCNKAIARRLGIAVGTVKSHLKSVFGKLDVESRTQAVAAVERRGLLRRSGEARRAAHRPHARPASPRHVDRQDGVGQFVH